jgi:hypothetical protein
MCSSNYLPEMAEPPEKASFVTVEQLRKAHLESVQGFGSGRSSTLLTGPRGVKPSTLLGADASLQPQSSEPI